MDRQKYCNELNRETFLAAMGYQVISFAYDDVSNRPNLCMTLLKMVISRFQTSFTPTNLNSVMDREIVRLAYTLAQPLRPVDVVTHLGINHRTAVRALKSLASQGVFTSVAGAEGKHVVRYQLQEGRIHQL